MKCEKIRSSDESCVSLLVRWSSRLPILIKDDEEIALGVALHWSTRKQPNDVRVTEIQILLKTSKIIDLIGVRNDQRTTFVLLAGNGSRKILGTDMNKCNCSLNQSSQKRKDFPPVECDSLRSGKGRSTKMWRTYWSSPFAFISSGTR